MLPKKRRTAAAVGLSLSLFCSAIPVPAAAKTTDLARSTGAEEIAAAIAFLCSKGAGMITGHNLLVDGGYTIK